MATVMVITLAVLAAGCVMSQSTIDDDESLLQQQLQLQIEKLQQQQQQMVQVLDLLLQYHQQQFSKLNEFQTILADRIGKVMSRSHRVGECGTRETDNKISYASLCTQLLCRSTLGLHYVCAGYSLHLSRRTYDEYRACSPCVPVVGPSLPAHVRRPSGVYIYASFELTILCMHKKNPTHQANGYE